VTTRRAALLPVLFAALAAGACAGAFPVRRGPIDLGPDRTRAVSISVEGPADMPEWGELLWGELAQALSAARGVRVVEPGPGVWLVKATQDTWDYDERAETQAHPRFAKGGQGFVAVPDYYRQCTAVMGVTVEVVDPAAAEPVAARKYLGGERGTQDRPRDKFQAPQTFLRRAAAKVAAQLAEDLEAGARRAECPGASGP